MFGLGVANRPTLWVVLALVLLMGSCGSSEEPAGTTLSPTTPPPVTTSSPTTDPTTSSTTADPTTSSTTADPTTSSTTADPGLDIVVHFSAGDGSDCSETTPFPRSVPGDDAVTAAFQELVKGPDEAELEAGAGSFFSKATSDIVRSANLDGGLLVVDFTDFRTLIPNASSSCGSEALLSQLDRTAFQFEMVERVQYQIIGSCHIFASWVQRDCFESTRTGRISVDPLIHERASGSGCTLEGGTLPDGRWFGFISFAAETEIDFDLACWFSGARRFRCRVRGWRREPCAQ